MNHHPTCNCQPCLIVRIEALRSENRALATKVHDLEIGLIHRTRCLDGAEEDLKTVRIENGKLRLALEFYGWVDHYTKTDSMNGPIILHDRGRVAREALAAGGE